MDRFESRYTVYVGTEKTEVNGYGTDSAAMRALAQLGLISAGKITVISSENERATYYGVLINGPTLTYSRKD